MTTTTASTSITSAPSVLDLVAARIAIDAGAPSKEWMLISPDGRAWVTEDVQKLFAVLAPYHPLLKLTG